MNIHFEELIAKHLKGTLSEDEKHLLAVMLKDPENLLYLAAKIDEQFNDVSLDKMVDDETVKEIYQRIQENLFVDVKRQTPLQTIQEPLAIMHIPWFEKKAFRLSVAVAASIILLIGLGVILNTYKNPGKSAVTVQTRDRHTNIALASIHREVNTTGKEKRLQLPDGSLIVLTDKSEIDYREPFTDKRDITLKGKAYFKVAKDKTRPFTVFSGVIATTALGTEFTVTAFENTSQIIVRLYEGKVVIKPVEKGNLKLEKQVYLSPGQQFVYGSKTITKIKAATSTNATPEQLLVKELPLDNPSLPQNDEGSWYMFNNQSLDQVFNQLSGMFNVAIVYNKKDIQNIYFTGKYERSYSLENILKEIATLHKLTITRHDNTYIINK